VIAVSTLPVATKGPEEANKQCVLFGLSPSLLIKQSEESIVLFP
jgi:hypothetical protein